MPSRTVLITGAAGNLGGHLARFLADTNHRLRLMEHRRPVGADLRSLNTVEIRPADLEQAETLRACCRGADCVVHFAGKLFAPGPKRFLPITNTIYAENLIGVAKEEGVSRFILISFPHVEGPTDPERPATDRRDREPISIHARTRLAAENALFEACRDGKMEPVVLRSGMVYAQDVLMIEYARMLLRKRLLGVWRRPTWIHLISLHDFLASTRAAIEKPALAGVVNLGDAEPMMLQAFLDRIADHWGLKRPWRAPRVLFFVAAWFVGLYARLFQTAAPLTVDFMRIGMVPYTMDTGRMRRELLPKLRYPTLEEGLTAM